MDNWYIDLKPFYSLIARYLLDERLVDKIELDDRRLVVHESYVHQDYEFTLSVHRIEGGDE